MIRNSEESPKAVDWNQVGKVVLCSRLNDELKRFVDEALRNKKEIHSLTPEARESIDSYITGANA